MEVHKKLGYGFLEKVYENSIMILLCREGITAIQQAPIDVYFEDQVVGSYFADILVEDKIIIELKCSKYLTNEHKAQTLNYLKATGKHLAILLNFGKSSLEHERLVL